jgi:Na+/H+-dicarboxylate symporter
MTSTKQKFKISNNYFILLAVILGVVTGILHVSFLDKVANVISEVFLNLLKLISLPIIFFSIVSTISGMKSFDEMKILGKKVLKYTLITTLIAAAIALGLFLIIDPVSSSTIVKNTVVGGGVVAGGTYLSFLLKTVPSNMFQTLGDNNNVLGVVFIAMLLSISILCLPEENKKVLNSFFSSFFAAILKITTFIVYLIPFGIWSFVSIFVGDFNKNGENFHGIFLFSLVVLLANLIQGFVVLPILLKLKGISPIKSVKGMFKALTIAFLSKSSNVALPVTMQCAQHNLKISPRVSKFSLPLCSVINMNGCAAFILIAVLFVSMSNGVHFSVLELIAWIFIATIAAIGNAGVPMGCYFLASAFLTSMNVPLYLMGVILPIYTIVDMVETALNVWSDSCVTAIVDKELQ